MSSTLAQTSPDITQPPEISSERLFRLSLEQYHAMGRAGVLSRGEPVELIDGLLVRKTVKNPPHVLAVNLLRDALLGALPSGWTLRIQDPISLATSEPEPDLAVVRGNARSFAGRHPSPNDLGLVIEVADANFADDRGIKKRLYAAEQIPAYWIVNLLDDRIEVYTDPVGRGTRSGYRHGIVCHVNDAVPIVLDGVTVGRIAVADILPD